LTVADKREAGRELLRLPARRGPLVVMHPGARASSRRWAPHRFAAVADYLIDALAARVVISGSAQDALVACDVLSTMKHEPLDVVGRTSLGGLAALIAQADLFIGNDSGPAHLAAAVGAKSIVIFGPEDPARWAALEPDSQAVIRCEVPCSPCHLAVCPIDHRCMTRVDVMTVSRAAMRLLLPTRWPSHQTTPSDLMRTSTREESPWIA
jgi:ADP-heptose:LPS heptosyltransferase